MNRTFVNGTTESQWEGEAPAEPHSPEQHRLGRSCWPISQARLARNSRRPGRQAFTLIELLVVIAIIAILMALLAAAVMKMLNVPPQKNTELLIQKLTASMDQQWKAAIDTAKSEAPNPGLWAQAQGIGGGDAQKTMDAYVQLRLQQEFPSSFAQAQAGGKPVYQQVLNGAPPPPTQYGNSPESSICLYTVITVGRRGMNFDSSGLSPKELRDAGNGMKGLYDGWDQPIRFITEFDQQKLTSNFKIISSGPNRQYENGNGDDVSSDKLRLGK